MHGKKSSFKMKNLFKSASENRNFILNVLILIITLNSLIILSYIGTSNILNKNIDEMASASLINATQSVRSKVMECQLYVRLVCDSLDPDDASPEKKETLNSFSKKMSDIFSEYYRGIYVEYDGKKYSDHVPFSVKDSPWYSMCRKEPNSSIVYIEKGHNLSDSYIVVSHYSDSKDILSAAFIDAGFFTRIIASIDSIDHIFESIIIDEDGKAMYYSDENIAKDYNVFLSKASSEKFLDDITKHRSGKCAFKLGGMHCIGYYQSLAGNWNIILYSRRDSLYRSLYIFNAIQYGVIVIIFLLFIFFYIKSYNNSLKLERALKTRSAFLTNMSHEIRTPLNAIIGMSEILLRRNVHGAARNDVVSIHNAGTGLLAIINDILDYSKIESGGFKIINDEYDLPGLLAEVVSLVSFRIKSTDVKLLVNVNPAVPKRLIGDEVRIKQILVNILGNAVKFTDYGYIILSVDWDFINNGETTLIFKVADTGIGIDESDLKMLFEEFIQASAGVKSKHHGTGLGLYISRTLAQQMGGDISVESALGKGSTFTIKIKNRVESYQPIAAVVDESLMLGLYEKDIMLAQILAVSFDLMHVKYRIIEDAKDLSQFDVLTHIFFRGKWKNEVGRILGSLDLSPKCILLSEVDEETEDANIKRVMLNLFGLQLADCLSGEVKYFDRYSGFDTGEIITIPDARALIVDDNITNMAVAKGILDEYNINIDTAADGAQAVEMVKANRYDIVFMDNMMPVMDGIEATRRIREMDGDYYKNLPIIALTALAGRGDRERFQSLGFDEFLSKPIDLNKMDIILHRFLQNKIKDIYDISNAKAENISTDIDLIIDTEAGIRQLGKNADSYADILTIYIQDMEKRYEQLISETSLEKNTINFHAIKGSSANVGAYKLNEMAAEMEALGKAGDIQQVETRTEQFLQLLDLTIQSAKDYLSEYQGKKNESKGYRFAVDPHYIAEIKRACADMDMIKIEDIYEKITYYVYPEDTMKILNDMKLASFGYDYDKILEAAGKLSKET